MRRICLLICLSLFSSLIHAAGMPITGLSNRVVQEAAVELSASDIGHTSHHAGQHEQSKHSDKDHPGCDLCIAAIPHQDASHSLSDIPNGAPLGNTFLKDSAPTQLLAKPPIS
ncbi:hypothetical protein TUM22923_13950 [Polynucleobacter sp. TUM22923]|jgi:hypothetical protein|uniref:hypothetical protein n=1 Tax=Polynucleobacter sp. TUM22923 TaxID=3022126 RepID=UPI002573693E|nr:hypothetical protein [Polynucleobacter sp. TUM22923]BDX22074.1 hypothetical protein TUM22923_13950 [Polynucleobacter sp. TUM22923]